MIQDGIAFMVIFLGFLMIPAAMSAASASRASRRVELAEGPGVIVA